MQLSFRERGFLALLITLVFVSAFWYGRFSASSAQPGGAAAGGADTGNGGGGGGGPERVVSARLMNAVHVRVASAHAEQRMSAVDERALLSVVPREAGGTAGDGAVSLPASVNLWQDRVGIVDQGPFGACTAFAARTVILGTLAAASSAPLPPEPSKAWLYARSRRALNLALNRDTGSTNQATVGVVAAAGTAAEAALPYYSFNVLPPTTQLATAILGTATGNTPPRAFAPLRFGSTAALTLAAMRAALASGKYVLVAFNVYPSMMTQAALVSGTVPVPSAAELRAGPVGGHAVALCGYDDATGRFLSPNSWGTECGARGFYTFPYAYLTNASVAGDAWTY